MPNGMSQTEYAARLKAYLNNQVALGTMSPEQAETLWQNTSTQLAGGASLSSLPYYGSPELSSLWLKPTTPTYPTGATQPRVGTRQLESNVQSIIQQAESLGMDMTGWAEEYVNAPTTSAKGYMLSGLTKAVNFQFDAQQIRESRIMAREFPEKFAEMEAERVKATPFHWQYRYDVDARDVFQSWFAGQPGGEEAKRAWEVKQYTEYPTLYPQYLQVGGARIGKTFQEWIKSEPAATAYLERRPVEYAPAFEEMVGGLAGTQHWRDWFEGKYSKLLRQFRGTLPSPSPGKTEVEKTWAEHLRILKPELKEEWAGLSPYQRGERPSVFAPKIRTVGF